MSDQPKQPPPKPANPLPFRERMKLMRDHFETHHYVRRAPIQDAPPLPPEQSAPDGMNDGEVFFCGRHLIPPLDPETREAFKNMFRVTPPTDDSEDGKK
jgi:hypothetical protein